MKLNPNQFPKGQRGNFQAETLADVGLLVQFDWFPQGPLHKLFENVEGGASESGAKKEPQPVTGYEVSPVKMARGLGRRAVQGDEDAALRLFLMVAASLMELQMVGKSRPEIYEKASEHAMAWPAVISPFGGIRKKIKHLPNLVSLGRLLLRVTSSRGSISARTSVCAFQLLAFMVLVRRGLANDDRYQAWNDACKKLPLLGHATWRTWWNVGKDIANDMYPQLHVDLYKTDAGQPKKYLGDAVHQLKTPFKNLWGLFAGIDNAPSAD